MLTLKKQKVKVGTSGRQGYKLQVVNHGTVTVEDLISMCVSRTTVTRADFRAVLAALFDTVSDSLADGYNVDMGDLGIVQVAVSSEGTETAEEYGSRNIKSVNTRMCVAPKIKKTIALGAPGINFRILT